MSITTIKSVTLAAFKEIAKVTQITIEQGETSGKLRGVNAEGQRICSVASEIKLTEPINALNMVDDETGEEWWFLVNDEARKAIATI